MGLPSQTGRMVAGRGVVARTRRRRRRNLPPVVVAGVGVAVVAGLAFIGWSLLGSGPSEAVGGEDTLAAASDNGDAQAPGPEGFGGAAPETDRDRPRRDEPEAGDDVVRIDQGSARGGLLRDAVEKPREDAGPDPLPPATPNSPPSTNPNPDRDPTPPAANPSEPSASGGRVAERDGTSGTGSTGTDATRDDSAARTGGALGAALAEADRLIAAGDRATDADLVRVRDTLWSMSRGEVPPAEVRGRLAGLNGVMVFSPRIVEGDTLTGTYRVRSGDSLARISNRESLVTHWKLIQRVNGLSNPNRIRVGQALKVVRGPFHAVVRKGSYRLDLYHGPPSEPGRWRYVRSFDVGLGEGDSTPTGSFVISDNKLENPGWVNPRDGRERYAPDDPGNPIGEFWLGLDGIGSSASITGYGIHGTIEPRSIGRQASMGCVRLRADDIALLYELLEEQISVVHIVE